MPIDMRTLSEGQVRWKLARYETATANMSDLAWQIERYRGRNDCPAYLYNALTEVIDRVREFDRIAREETEL